MSLEELQVITWLFEWEDFKGKKCWDNRTGECYRISSAAGRPGVHDFDYSQYESIAYELYKGDELLARTEGRDALNRLEIVRNNYIALRG